MIFWAQFQEQANFNLSNGPKSPLTAWKRKVKGHKWMGSNYTSAKILEGVLDILFFLAMIYLCEATVCIHFPLQKAGKYAISFQQPQSESYIVQKELVGPQVPHPCLNLITLLYLCMPDTVVFIQTGHIFTF